MENHLIKNNKTMKKCFLFLFLIISGFYINAQSVSIDDYNQNPGTDLIVPVNIENLANMGALTLFIGYDTLVLHFDTVLNIDAQFAGLLFNDMAGLQKVGLAWSASNSGVSVSSVVLCEIKFNYIGGSSDLTFKSGSEIADFNADIMSVSLSNGSISESFIVEISGINLNYCISDPAVTLTGSPIGGNFEVNGSPSAIFEPQVSGIGMHTISYAYVNEYGFGDTVSTNVEVYGNPVINIQSSGVICFGQAAGEASIIISSGQTPFQFNWSDGQTTQNATSLGAGVYTVTVTDFNGCMANDNIEIVSSTEIVYSVDVTHVTSPASTAGAIDLTLTGGISPFQFTWSNASTLEDLTGVTYGNYLFTITDNLGCSVNDSAEVKIISSQQVNIPIQWSIISFNIDPLEKSADSVFASILPSLILAKDEAGSVFWTFFQLNAIGDIDIGEGYQMKMSDPDTIIVDGYYLFPELTPVYLPLGWSLFGYLRTSPQLIVTAMSPVVSNVLMVKSGEGGVYWPAFTLDQIINIIPGKGYQVKMSNSDTLYFSPN